MRPCGGVYDRELAIWVPGQSAVGRDPPPLHPSALPRLCDRSCSGWASSRWSPALFISGCLRWSDSGLRDDPELGAASVRAPRSHEEGMGDGQ